MKFSVSSSELVKGLSAVIGAVPSKATLPILETVLFKSEDGKLRLTSSDLEISIVHYIDAHITEEGAIAIPAKRLNETLRQLPDIPVEFTIHENNTVSFKTNNGTYKLAGESADDFPEIVNPEDGLTINTTGSVIRKAIKKTVFAVSNDDLRPAMMGVLFQIGEEESRFVATDGHRLVRYTNHGIKSSESRDFIIPNKALSQVEKLIDDDVCTIHISEDHALFQSDRTRIVTRLINEPYPKYEAVIPKDNDKILTINKLDMLATVKRVAIFSSTSTHQVRLQLEPGKLTIKAEDIDLSSEAKETITCDYKDEAMEIGFNARYLADVLSNIEDQEVLFEFSTPNRAGILKPVNKKDDESILMLVMPVMLNNYA
jgi:DNA polymerase-3 subunit beta